MNRTDKYKKGSALYKTRAYSLTVLISYVILFLFMSHLMCNIPQLPMRMVPAIMQILFSALVAALMGKVGYYYSIALNLTQVAIFAYELVVFKYESSPFLMLCCILAVIITSLILRVQLKTHKDLKSLKRIYQDARTQNLTLQEEKRSVNDNLVRSDLSINLVESEELSYSPRKNLKDNTFYDPLTTLPNRAMIIEQIDTLIGDSISFSQSLGGQVGFASDSPISIIYISIDRFSEITTSLGHPIMDLFLQSTAHILREAAEPSDLVGRVSGGEFVVVVKRSLSEDDLISYVEKLRLAIDKSFRIDSNEISLTSSVGISQYPRDARFPGELLRFAESAMSTAVSSGGNQIQQYRAKNRIDTFLSHLSIEELREIFNIAFKDGQIFMVYQPRFSSERKLIGVEAFLRWIHPDHGQIRTLDMIEAAEKCGEIYALGKFTFEQSFNTLKHMNAINPDLTMTVNLSSVQLRSGILLRDLKDILNATECVAENLEFDVPEECLITSFENAKPVLAGIDKLGIKTSLDNFGRGYSSLNNIPLLPVSCVKLDGFFTHNLQNDSALRVLTSSIVSLLHEIDIRISATGIGEEGEFAILKKYGCDIFQGTFFQTPMKESELIKFVRTNTFQES